MADEPIDLAAERNKRANYVDYARIRTALDAVLQEAEAIAIKSAEQCGTVDQLAYEMCAYVSAIERAIDAPLPEGDTP